MCAPSNGTWRMRTASFLRIEQVVVLGAPSSDFHFGGAVWLWAHPKCTVLVAEPMLFCWGGTIWCLASFEFVAAAVLDAESSCVFFGGAAWMDAHSL